MKSKANKRDEIMNNRTKSQTSMAALSTKFGKKPTISFPPSFGSTNDNALAFSATI